jgi:hypothetical protein
MLTVTDTIDPNRTYTGPADGVAASIAGWFLNAPPEVLAVVRDFEQALINNTDTVDALATYLAVKVSHTGPQRQFCRACLRSRVPAVTVDSPRGRLHFCDDHTTYAEPYQANAQWAKWYDRHNVGGIAAYMDGQVMIAADHVEALRQNSADTMRDAMRAAFDSDMALTESDALADLLDAHQLTPEQRDDVITWVLGGWLPGN